MARKIEILVLNIKVLQNLLLWPEGDVFSRMQKLKQILAFGMSYVVYSALIAAIVRQIKYGIYDFTALIEQLIAFGDIFAVMYMKICLLKKLPLMKKLVEAIHDFEEFCPYENFMKTEQNLQAMTKMITAYTFGGNILNAVVPLLDIPNCNVRRTDEFIKKRDPCGLIARCYWPMDVSHAPYFEIVYSMQLIAGFLLTMAGIAITMSGVGLLIHLIAQLKYLRQMLGDLNLYQDDDEQLKSKVKFCVRYHIQIIKYAEDINEAFSSQMLMHITLTSFVISVLGFEILMVDNLTDSIRFSLHLLGWFILLFLICFYGQKLIDESIGVAHDVYSTQWYNCPVGVQKDLHIILLRSQRPLTLNAINFGVMSLATFLRILSSAYSYFTLLVNLKS